MCLGIPGQITELLDVDGVPHGNVDFGGTRRRICLAYVPEAAIGDWVLVHVGFAISQLSEDEAQQTLSDLRELAELSDDPEATP